MKKIRAQTAFLRDFDEVYELQEDELAAMREECLAERIAITKMKQGGYLHGAGGNATAAEVVVVPQVFADNEFALSSLHQCSLPHSMANTTTNEVLGA